MHYKFSNKFMNSLRRETFKFQMSTLTRSLKFIINKYFLLSIYIKKLLWIHKKKITIVKLFLIKMLVSNKLKIKLNYLIMKCLFMTKNKIN